MSRVAVNFLFAKEFRVNDKLNPYKPIRIKYTKPRVKVIHRNGVDIFVHVNKFKQWEQNNEI